MKIINWQQFGLRGNPYDILPLIEGGELPIRKAFVGREQELEFLNNLFESENRLCLTICGDVGVGKTSLANVHKFVWKYKKQKSLFSFRREIEACENLLNKKSFLLEIIGSILREIKLLQPELLSNELLKKLHQIVDIAQTTDISSGATIFGIGANYGTTTTPTQPIQLSTTILEDYFVSLVNFIKNNKIKGKRYSGVIIHVNNFDVVLSNPEEKRKVIKFFNEVRDILQSQNVYFLFLGPKNFFKDIISSQQRVKSIFYQNSLNISPLSKKEIILAFDERMKLLQSHNVSKYIKPIEDEAVFHLYSLYRGDIRSIMSSIKSILEQCSDKLTKSLSLDESKLLLGKERWSRINKELTTEQKGILNYLIEKKQISQKEIVAKFRKNQSNVSSYYFKPLRDKGVIEEKERIGKIIYWGLTLDYTPLEWLVKLRKKIEKNISKKSGQLALL